MEIQIKDLLILALAIWVGLNLPEWAKKLVPDGIAKLKIPGGLKFVGQFVLAYGLAWLGWGALANHLNSAMGSFRDLSQADQITAVVNIPEILIAIAAIVVPLLLVKAVFKALPEAQNGTDTLVAVGILVVLFLLNGAIWDLVRNYAVLNLEGAESLTQTEPFKVLESYLSAP